jgi:hypothetical protein
MATHALADVSFPDPLGGPPVAWAEVWAGCLPRVRRWRTPPRWSGPGWLEELHAEAVVGALATAPRYDPGRGVPLSLYLRMGALGRAIACHRCEWRYALLHRNCGDKAGWLPCGRGPGAAAAGDLLGGLLVGLAAADRVLLERLYGAGETEAEVARDWGVSQQAVSKRKGALLRRLRDTAAADPKGDHAG